jgi:KipI family sensor histidine kinase inhibitor
MRLLPYGPDAFLVEVASTDHALALHAGLNGRPGIRETVPAARTVLVVFDTALLDGAAVANAIAALRAPVMADRPAATEVVLDVHYDGPDLADTAAMLRLTSDDVVRRHTAVTYVVAFCGFSPGFAYLTGLDPALHVPRLGTPRTTVPAGAVGVAGEFTGVYPRPSPGGWRLLGTTDAVLWDPDRDPPALLAPGTSVRFRAT